ncbi:MAG: hypothetical protein AB7N71_05135 [Phycisphaerae bacterium]
MPNYTVTMKLSSVPSTPLNSAAELAFFQRFTTAIQGAWQNRVVIAANINDLKDELEKIIAADCGTAIKLDLGLSSITKLSAFTGSWTQDPITGLHEGSGDVVADGSQWIYYTDNTTTPPTTYRMKAHAIFS